MRRLVLALAGILAAARVAPAQRSLTIERFDMTATVATSGRLFITENLTARFSGEWNGLYRTIPLNYRTPDGLNYRLQLRVLAVTDGAGNKLKHESRRGEYLKLKVWVPGAHDATRTVILRYRVDNGLRFFDDHDELYWNVTGNEWEIPIERAYAHIALPGNVSGLRTVVYTGPFGSRAADATVQTNGPVVEMATTKSLSAGEGLTAVVGWNPGVVKRPTFWSKAGIVVRSNLLLLIPLLALIFMWRRWYVKGRDPMMLPIMPHYEPPEGMTPAETGTLIDNEADIRDITATVVDLAVRGFLRIEEREDSHMLGLFKSKGYTFYVVKPKTEWQSLAEHEQDLLKALFFIGDKVDDTDLHNHFYQDLPGIQEAIFDALVYKGYYNRRPSEVKQRYVVSGVAIAMALGWGGMMAANALGFGSPVSAVVAAIATGLIIVGFGLLMPARTVSGARQLEKVLGFEEFLRRVEEDRFERTIKTPELFEKYLPYAMALNVDRNWCAAFKDICTTPPSWYNGSYSGGFNTFSFNSSLQSMASNTGSQMASAPRSSGSSGFGGGGGSGGGGGGGGGGGF